MTDTNPGDLPSREWAEDELDVVIVGAGFGGLCMLHALRELGFRVRLYEAGSGIGGVWFFNRYPGARCDVESVDYSYSFDPALDQEWHWPERYATQAEILRYINHVADRFDLWSDIRLNALVTAATFDAARERWCIAIETGDRVSAKFCIMATGALSVARVPDYPGLSEFEGVCYHTAAWPDEEIDFTGKNVAVIGTGSSGVQVIPVVAEQARRLYVFQRTPNFVVPAQHAVMDEEYEREVKADYPARRRTARETASGLFRDISRQSALEVSAAERWRVYEENWQTAGFGFILAFSDLVLNEEANQTVVKFIHSKIAAEVNDPAVAELLSPKHHPFGTKRPCVASDYYRTFNRDNVFLVDLVRTPIERITRTGISTTEQHYELDIIVFATGFDAMTGALMNIDIRGLEGQSLRDKWAGGPRTYLGVATAGFPNMFIIAGPGSPSVLTNVIVSIEQHVGWISEFLDYARAHSVDRIDADIDAEDAWVTHVNDMAAATLYPTADSWYLGSNVPGKPRVFMPYPGGLRRYRRKCDAVAAGGYEGFALTRARTPVARARDS